MKYYLVRTKTGEYRVFTTVYLGRGEVIGVYYSVEAAMMEKKKREGRQAEAEYYNEHAPKTGDFL